MDAGEVILDSRLPGSPQISSLAFDCLPEFTAVPGRRRLEMGAQMTCAVVNHCPQVYHGTMTNLIERAGGQLGMGTATTRAGI